MKKIGFMVVSLLLWALVVSFCQADQSEKGLIKVVPQYRQAAYNQDGAGNGSEDGASAPTYPRPQDQMYVFWFLGKVISYPVDMAESLVVKGLERARAQKTPPTPLVVETRNPFDVLEKGQIPPAPPVQ